MKVSNIFRNSSTINKTENVIFPLKISKVSIKNSKRNRSRNTTRKRSLNSLNISLPSNKRPCLNSLYKQRESPVRLNRIHHYIILRNYNKNIYKINSRVVILATLKSKIKDKTCEQRFIKFRLISQGINLYAI